MTIQPFTQQVTATSDSSGNITLTFPAVPQGLVWTGSITLYSPLTPGGTGGGRTGTWDLLVSQRPVMSFNGQAVVYDVQAVSQAVVTITGQGLKSATQITATWSGYSCDTSEVTYVAGPRIYGQQDPYVQVYTDPIGGPGSALSVVPTTSPHPSQLLWAQAFSSTPGSVTTMVSGAGGAVWSLWQVSLNVSAAYTGSTVQALPFLASLVIGGANGTNLLSLEPICIQASTQTVSQTLDCKGLNITGQDLVMSLGGFSAGTAVRVNATVIYGPPVS